MLMFNVKCAVTNVNHSDRDSPHLLHCFKNYDENGKHKSEYIRLVLRRLRERKRGKKEKKLTQATQM